MVAPAVGVLARANHRAQRRATLRTAALHVLAARIEGSPMPTCPHRADTRAAHYWHRGATLAHALADQLEAIAP